MNGFEHFGVRARHSCDFLTSGWPRRECTTAASAQPRRTAKSKTLSVFYRLAPAAPSAFFDVLHPRYFQHRFGQKKLLENSLFAIRFLCVFLMFSHARYFQHRFGPKKNLLKTPCLPSVFFAFFLMFSVHSTSNTNLDKKKKLVENSLFAIRFLCVFFDVFHARFFGVYGHLPTRSENGVAQIQHMCPVVFGQRAAIVDSCCLVVI